MVSASVGEVVDVVMVLAPLLREELKGLLKELI